MKSLKETLETIDKITYNETGLELLALWRRQCQVRAKIESDIENKSDSLEETAIKESNSSEFIRGLYFSREYWMDEFVKEYQIILDRIIELFDLEELYKKYNGEICNLFSKYAFNSIDFDGLISELRKIARRHFIPALKN